MDGNGRWAEREGVSVAEGHRAGTRALRRTVEAAIDIGIETLVVYAFSTENWARPADEVADLLVLLAETVDAELPDLAKQGVRSRFLGRRDRIADAIPPRCASWRSRPPISTRSTSGSRSTTAGGRSSWRPRGGSSRRGSTPSGSTRRRSPQRLYAPELADLDLLVRTSGELRLSNFMLWEAAYAELVFADTLWPDFGEEQLRAAVDGLRGARAPVRRTERRVSAFWSRIVVAAVLLPLVLGLVWAGGWWLFGLALVGGLLALHELYGMSRALRPIVLGGYAGLLLALLGAQLGDVEWVLLGILATLPAALLAFCVSSARQNAVAGFAMTLLGVAWVGGGLALLLLLRDIPERRQARTSSPSS